MNAKKILQFSIGPVGAAAIGLLSLPLVAWYFSAEDLGRLSMLQVAVGFALLLFSLGLDQAYVREFHEEDDKPSLLKATFLPGFIVLIAVLTGGVFSPYSLSFLLFGIESLSITVLLCITVVLSFFSRFLSLILRMQERGFAYSMSQLLPKFLFLLVILSYILCKADAVFKNLLTAYFISIFAVFAIFVWSTRKDWLPCFSAKINREKQIQMVRYALPLIASGLAFWGLTAIDKIFLRSFSTFSELGIYSLAVSFAAVALVFQSVFSTVWAPVVYRWAANGVESKKIEDVIDYVTLAILIIWSLTGMLSWIVALILPAEYTKVPHILLAAIAYPLLYTLSEATGVGVGISRKTGYSLLAAAISFSVNVIGNWLLIPSYGAAGAAVASLLAFFTFFIIRTEASVIVWIGFSRKRMYLLVSSISFVSVIVNLFDINEAYLVSLYGSMFFLSVIVYLSNVKQAYFFLKKIIM